MNIEAKEFEIKMIYGELWATAWDVQSALIHTLETHWVNHQQNWKDNEKERIHRLKNMFLALGRPDIFDQCMNKAEEIFRDFNSKTK